MIDIKNIFPTDENEKNLIKFIGCYQYLAIKDLKYFFDTTYYPKRILRLINNSILRKYEKCLVLGENGQDFLKLLGETTTPQRYNKNYTDRLKFISHLAAVYNGFDFITFTPSTKIKEKTAYTESSRKYIGILNISGTNYLTYHIASQHTKRYINSIIYDIQKETKYKNIIILVNDIKRINFKEFAFGVNSVVICEDNDESLKELKYLHQTNWPKIIQTLYKNNVHISEYNFCDYTDNKEKYISTFHFIDTEKINRIDMFLKNNVDKQADVICNENIVHLLGQEIPTVNFKLINLDEFIERDVKVYD